MARKDREEMGQRKAQINILFQFRVGHLKILPREVTGPSNHGYLFVWMILLLGFAFNHFALYMSYGNGFYKFW